MQHQEPEIVVKVRDGVERRETFIGGKRINVQFTTVDGSELDFSSFRPEFFSDSEWEHTETD